MSEHTDNNVRESTELEFAVTKPNEETPPVVDIDIDFDTAPDTEADAPVDETNAERAPIKETTPELAPDPTPVPGPTPPAEQELDTFCLEPTVDISSIAHPIDESDEVIEAPKDTAVYDERVEVKKPSKSGPNNKPEAKKTPDYSGEAYRDRITTLMKIKGYIDEFKYISEEFVYDDIVKIRDLNKLEKVLDTIRVSVSNKDTRNSMKRMYYFGVGLVEKIGCKAGFLIENLAASITSNEAIANELTEVCIEHGTKYYTDPMIRLAASTLLMAYALHNHNKTIKSLRDLDKSVPQPMTKEYEDL